MEEKSLAELERQLEDKERELREMTKQAERQEQTAERAKRQGRALLLAALGMVALLVIMIVVMALVFAFTLVEMDTASPAMAEEFLQAVADRDEERAWALMYPGSVAREEFGQTFEETCRFWQEQGGGDTFTLRRGSLYINSGDGMSRYEAKFSVKSGQTTFHLTLIRVVQGNRSGIIRISII